MRLNKKLAWGMAWTGLALIVAVPSADFLTGRQGDNKAAVLTSTTEPVKVAATPAASTPAPSSEEPVRVASTVTTTRTANGVIITPAGSPLPTDPVSNYLSTGKPLPDYITSADSNKAASSSAEPTQVAAIDPVTPPAPAVAPVPFPSWARPPDTPKVTPAPVAETPTAPPSTAEPLVIVDTPPGSDVADVQPSGPVPPADIVDDSANWNTDGLRQYLRNRGLLSDGGDRSTASVTTVDSTSGNYDPNGFYLSDGPNSGRQVRRPRPPAGFDEDTGDRPSFNLF